MIWVLRSTLIFTFFSSSSIRMIGKSIRFGDKEINKSNFTKTKKNHIAQKCRKLS